MPLHLQQKNQERLQHLVLQRSQNRQLRQLTDNVYTSMDIYLHSPHKGCTLLHLYEEIVLVELLMRLFENQPLQGCISSQTRAFR